MARTKQIVGKSKQVANKTARKRAPATGGGKKLSSCRSATITVREIHHYHVSRSFKLSKVEKKKKPATKPKPDKSKKPKAAKKPTATKKTKRTYININIA